MQNGLAEGEREDLEARTLRMHNGSVFGFSRKQSGRSCTVYVKLGTNEKTLRWVAGVVSLRESLFGSAVHNIPRSRQTENTAGAAVSFGICLA